jgi:hypothetical protein
MFDSKIIRSVIRTAIILAFALSVAGFGGIETLFTPKAELWERWTAHQPGSNAKIDHSTWDWFLKSYVSVNDDGVNRVAYSDVDQAGHDRLDDYIRSMTEVTVDTLSRDEQLAYWINLYNALTVRVVLRHYPVETIRDINISPGLFSNGPWDNKLIEIDGEPISLNDIEHRILRPIWRDPRIHYAVNCASISCPNLQRDTYTGDAANQMLEDAAFAYVNDKRGISAQNNRVVVSSIYAWFIDDFGGNVAGLILHLKRYAKPSLASALDNAVELQNAYDWALNDDVRN